MLAAVAVKAEQKKAGSYRTVGIFRKEGGSKKTTAVNETAPVIRSIQDYYYQMMGVKKCV